MAERIALLFATIALLSGCTQESSANDGIVNDSPSSEAPTKTLTHVSRGASGESAEPPMRSVQRLSLSECDGVTTDVRVWPNFPVSPPAGWEGNPLGGPDWTLTVWICEQIVANNQLVVAPGIMMLESHTNFSLQGDSQHGRYSSAQMPVHIHVNNESLARMLKQTIEFPVEAGLNALFTKSVDAPFETSVTATGNFGTYRFENGGDPMEEGEDPISGIIRYVADTENATWYSAHENYVNSGVSPITIIKGSATTTTSAHMLHTEVGLPATGIFMMGAYADWEFMGDGA